VPEAGHHRRQLGGLLAGDIELGRSSATRQAAVDVADLLMIVSGTIPCSVL
jgi:hypothetical protein